MKYSISIPENPYLPICDNEDVFPVSRIFGIGRNYSTTPQMEEKDEQKVVMFMKDPYMLSFVDNGIKYPSNTSQLRYEIELVVAISKGGCDISKEGAENHIYGYAMGIDFTKYDIQDIAKQHGWPWDKGKSFRGCAPCTSITRKQKCSIDSSSIWLKQNGKLVQNGNLNQMIWTVPEIISMVSRYFELIPGDLIFTGTPGGVGMTNKGDEFEGGMDALGSFKLKVK